MTLEDMPLAWMLRDRESNESMCVLRDCTYSAARGIPNSVRNYRPKIAVYIWLCMHILPTDILIFCCKTYVYAKFCVSQSYSAEIV